MRSRVLIRTLVALAATLCVGLAGSPAEARWLRAESPRFVVYSEGSDGELRDYVAKLELFDTLLRSLHGLPPTGVPPRKLDIYLVKTKAGLQRVNPAMSENVAGFYSAGPGDIFAVSLRGDDVDYVVLHEYTHHFMYQYFPYGYPGWLVEGYAEYFMTTEMRGQFVEVGKIGDRAQSLVDGTWLPMETVLGKRSGSVADGNQYYAQAWVLTHYLMSDPARYKQLRAYMLAVGEGQDHVKAMEAATGLSIRP